MAEEKVPPCKNFVKYFLTFINILMSVLIAAAGALGINSTQSIDDTSIIVIGIYLILFSAILFFYEVVQVCPCSWVDNIMKKNFGFLYGTYGKNIYLMLMSFLCFGLLSSSSSSSSSTTSTSSSSSSSSSSNLSGNTTSNGSNAQNTAIAAGVLGFVFGILQMVLYATRPSYFDKKEKFVP